MGSLTMRDVLGACVKEPTTTFTIKDLLEPVAAPSMVSAISASGPSSCACQRHRGDTRHGVTVNVVGIERVLGQRVASGLVSVDGA
jgi:hypothetical protein